MRLRPDQEKHLFLAWAESGGFAATHDAGATSEAIVDDLLTFLRKKGVALFLVGDVMQDTSIFPWDKV
jgi:hypothetical protein